MSTSRFKFRVCGLESRQKTEEMTLFCLPAGRNSGRTASKADKKRDKCVIFVYRLVEIQGAQPRKQTKNGGNVSFLSTTGSKSGPRGLESRQKTGEMSLFCLPPAPNSVRSVSKVEQNHPKLKKYSTRFHRRNARLVTNVADQTQKQIRHGRQQCQNFHCDRKPASRNDSADKPRSVVGICPPPRLQTYPNRKFLAPPLARSLFDVFPLIMHSFNLSFQVTISLLYDKKTDKIRL